MSALRFDLEALRERLGEKRFLRAESYADRGMVRLLAIEDRRVSALVSGETGAVYRVELSESGEGWCACPDFAETSACKHLGATALTASGIDPAAARRLNGRLARIREALAFEDTRALTEVIVRLAREVPGVLEALEPEPGAEGAG